jgi:hypothetical protein
MIGLPPHALFSQWISDREGTVTQPLFAGVTPASLRHPGPVAMVVIDAEEDFDWNTPVQGTQTSTTHMKNVRVLQHLLSAFGIVPTYLLTYPVLEDAEVVAILRRQVSKGQCIVGIQLHPWVTPPFDETPSTRRSFSGNLEDNLEEQKLVSLKAKFSQTFGIDPVIYRAGRYGLSEGTGHLLEKHGFEIDTSIAPRTNFEEEGGRDYSGFGYQPFWFGEHRRLLEIPLCRDVVGWAGQWACPLYQAFSGPVLSRLHAPSILTRSRCAERVTLSPEGNDVAAMQRLVHGLLARGQQVFSLSFHSSSLQVGRNPYVQSKADLHHFYDRMSAMLDHMATRLAFRFVSTMEAPALLVPPPGPAA